MSEHDDFDTRIRISLQREAAIRDDGFSARVLAGIKAPAPVRVPAGATQIVGLTAVPTVVVLLALSGLMPTTFAETLLSALLLTGGCALVWIGTASNLPSRHVFQRPPPH